MSAKSISSFDDKPNPSISARVWNLQVDNQFIYSGPTGAGAQDRFLNERDGFRKLTLPDLQLIGTGAPNGYVLTKTDIGISFQPASGGGSLPDGTRTQQVLLWDNGTQQPYWGNLFTTPDFSIDTSGFGTQYGLNFIETVPALVELTSDGNPNRIASMCSTFTSIGANSDKSTIVDSSNANIGAYTFGGTIISTNGAARPNIAGSNFGTTAQYCSMLSSNGSRILNGSYNTSIASNNVVQDNINIFNSTYSSTISSVDCSISNSSYTSSLGSASTTLTNCQRAVLIAAGTESSGMVLNNCSNVAAFGFHGGDVGGLTDKVIGGIDTVQWCLHNDTGVIDVSAVNTTGPFPSGQSRWMEIESEVNPDQYGRLVRLGHNFKIDYARNDELAFGIIRNKDSAPLQFNSVKSGRVKKTDIWGKYIKDEEGNFIHEDYEAVPRALIETHGEYICQFKGDLVAGDYLKSDPNGFAVKSDEKTNLRCYGVLDSDDRLLTLNDSKACRCYINPLF